MFYVRYIFYVTDVSRLDICKDNPDYSEILWLYLKYVSYATTQRIQNIRETCSSAIDIWHTAKP